MTAGDDVANLQQQLNTFGSTRDESTASSARHRSRPFVNSNAMPGSSRTAPAARKWRALDRLSRTVKGGAARTLRSEHHHAMARTGVSDKVVVIDPGHGGPDYGDVVNRLAEAIVADDLCRRIEGRLAAIGTQVLVTRPRSHEIEEELMRRLAHSSPTTPALT